MTLAIDKQTGAVIGQVIYSSPAIPMRKDIPKHVLRIFGKDGYRYVDAASVRLERMEDN